MSRVATKALQIFLDVAALAIVWVLAFFIRFDWNVPGDQLHRCLTLLPYVVGLKYAVLHFMGVPRFSWRYIGLKEVSRILVALLASSIVLVAIRLLATPLGPVFRLLRYVWAPMGILAIDLVLGFLAVAGVRALRRIAGENALKRERADVSIPAVPTMLIGAGQAGLIVAKEIEARPALGIRAVGFLDDDPRKLGSVVHGIPVVGATADLAKMCKERGAQQALITVASAAGKDIRRILELCEEASIGVKIVPSVHEIVGGKVGLTRLRSVAIEDLLRREPVTLDESAISADVKGAVVMVTGAGGSIGSELCRQICRYSPRVVLLVEQAENALFEIHRELSASFTDVTLVPAVADITDNARIRALVSAHRPRVVLHAAAHKHVPMMEWNPGEAIKNNVLGTKCVADVAHEMQVERFVMISTDKAVNPTSIMGATKRIAELYIQALSAQSRTRFVAVRFGNVLGSAGSVIPIFREQIARGGPVTVTHPEMSRYFMTIPEASQLVLQAATMGKGGEIFILDMGEPVRIVDLAEDLVRLSGLRPREDIEIRFSGIRPGEKLFEELSVADENADKTYHPKVFVGRLPTVDLSVLGQQLRDLAKDADLSEADALRAKLMKMVPEFHPSEPQPRPPVVKPAPEHHLDVALAEG